MPPAGIHELSPSCCGAIIALHNEDYSYRRISTKTGCSVHAAFLAVKREQNFHTRYSLLRSG